ncbi:MAG: Hpt domain-containing protein, partial [Candidatus Obscuribacterales bacterium]|nr:Hpt domain-containing protein [Candidatus Obscuribacterales bacterium]
VNIVAIHELAEEFDVETAKELAFAFLQDTNDSIDRIDSGIADRDSESVRKAAHMLKGCSRVIKASMCEATCKQLELDAENGNWEAMKSSLQELKTIYAATEAFLKAYTG